MVNINGSTFEFAPEGEEIGSGTYYKFLSVNEMYYEYVSGTHTQWVWWPFKKKTVTDYASVYKNFGQESTVYLCSNNPSAVSFTSKATDAYEIKTKNFPKKRSNFCKGKDADGQERQLFGNFRKRFRKHLLFPLLFLQRRRV